MSDSKGWAKKFAFRVAALLLLLICFGFALRIAAAHWLATQPLIKDGMISADGVTIRIAKFEWPGPAWLEDSISRIANSFESSQSRPHPRLAYVYHPVDVRITINAGAEAEVNDVLDIHTSYLSSARSLNVTNRSDTAEYLDHLGQFQQLESLSIDAYDVSHVEWGMIDVPPQLRELVVSRAYVDRAFSEWISKAQQLNTLHLFLLGTNDDALQELRKLRNLKAFTYRHQEIVPATSSTGRQTPTFITEYPRQLGEVIADMQQLQVLELAEVNAEVVECIARLPNLQKLSVGVKEVSDRDIEPLLELSTLELLILANTKLSRGTLMQFGGLDRLRTFAVMKASDDRLKIDFAREFRERFSQIELQTNLAGDTGVRTYHLLE